MASTQSRNHADARWHPRCPTLVSYHFEEELPDENRIIISVDLLRELTSIAPGIFGKPTSSGRIKRPRRPQPVHGQQQYTASRNLHTERHTTATTPDSGQRSAREERSRIAFDLRSRFTPESGEQLSEEQLDEERVVQELGRQEAPEEIKPDNGRRNEDDISNKDGRVTFEEDVRPISQDETRIRRADHQQEKRAAVPKSSHSKPLLRRPILTNGNKVYRTTSSQRWEVTLLFLYHTYPDRRQIPAMVIYG